MIEFKTKLKYAAIISLLHLILTISTIVCSFSIGMEYFDSDKKPNPVEMLIERSSGAIANICIFPGEFVYFNLPISMRSNSIEWAVMLGNSLLWGFSILLVWELLKKIIPSFKKSFERTR